MTAKTLRYFFGLVLAIALSLIAFVVAYWEPDRPVQSLKQRWATPPSAFIEVQGMQVHWRDEGPPDDPEPIVLLHGTSASLHTWQAWADQLKTQRRVIRLDLPGFGLTGPHPMNAYAYDDYAQFIGAFLDKVGVKRCVLAGNSLGGAIAWTSALQLGDKVSRLILVDSGGYDLATAQKPPSLPIGFVIARMPGLRLIAEYTLPRFVVERSVRNVYADPSKVSADLVDRYVELTLREGNRKALGKRMAIGFTGKVEQLSQLKQPTLILWGAQDRLIAKEFGERFDKDIPNSKLVVFPQLGHVPQEEDPLQSLAPVLEFLAKR